MKFEKIGQYLSCSTERKGPRNECDKAKNVWLVAYTKSRGQMKWKESNGLNKRIFCLNENEKSKHVNCSEKMHFIAQRKKINVCVEWNLAEQELCVRRQFIISECWDLILAPACWRERWKTHSIQSVQVQWNRNCWGKREHLLFVNHFILMPKLQTLGTLLLKV